MGMTEEPESMSDAELRELLAAHALHASLPSEAVALEHYLARNPDAAAELARLSTAAAWIGATEALTPPPALRRVRAGRGSLPPARRRVPRRRSHAPLPDRDRSVRRARGLARTGRPGRDDRERPERA